MIRAALLIVIFGMVLVWVLSGLLVWLIAAGLVGLVALRIYVGTRRQIQRNKEARRLIDQQRQDLEASTARDYVVYLRSFNEDFFLSGRLSLSKLIGFVSQGKLMRLSEAMPVYELEQFLANAFAKTWLVVGLGRPRRFKQGAGLVSVKDDEWQDYVTTMCDRSRAIFMVPGKSTGTLWEIEQLATRPEWLKKTIFFMPNAGVGTAREINAFVDFAGSSLLSVTKLAGATFVSVSQTALRDFGGMITGHPHDPEGPGPVTARAPRPSSSLGGWLWWLVTLPLRAVFALVILFFRMVWQGMRWVGLSITGVAMRLLLGAGVLAGALLLVSLRTAIAAPVNQVVGSARRREWARIQEAAQGAGLRLPDYEPGGLVFTLTDNHEPVVLSSLSGVDMQQIALALTSALEGDESDANSPSTTSPSLSAVLQTARIPYDQAHKISAPEASLRSKLSRKSSPYAAAG